MLIMGQESTPLDQRYFPHISVVWELFNDLYRIQLLGICVWLLKSLGYAAILFKGNAVAIGEYGGVSVGNYCLGFQLIYYFTMMMLISELPGFKKISGIIIGFVLINLMNVIRISAMAAISVSRPDLTALFHDHVFNVIVFGILMIYYYNLVKTPERKML